MRDSSEAGRLKLAFNRPADQVNYRSKYSYQRSNQQDTLLLFTSQTRTDTLYIGIDSSFTDTLLLQANWGQTKPYSPLQLLHLPERNFNPTQPLLLAFNRPLDSLRQPLIQLYKDTFPSPLAAAVEKDTLDFTRLRLPYNWQENTNYRLSLLPGALQDIHGQVNKDTIALSFKTLELKSLGTLNLNVSNLDSSQQYVLRLVKGNNRDLVQEWILSKRTRFEAVVAGLLPANYQLEVIEDRKANGRYDPAEWDTGFCQRLYKYSASKP
ncbi:MAG: hypothetical protein HC821_00115 [Lewinella sp.]|nr:hypothetical protein [Lewinella sp.]